MQLKDYIGKQNFNMINFAMSLIDEVDSKVQNRTLYYKNQIIRYIDQQVNQFVRHFHEKESLQAIYKAEIYLIINPKLTKLFNDYKLFTCI
ncbi:hypothetical protein ACNRWW_11985 [Metabacillus sp. HB246100]|uniref:hypothetical protein n=1 Tax=Bacillus weihaiensis TaxID=1547283 RepID=UPI0023559C27|nr:hypothetical protein [Bacillus weihaiensis]